MGRQRDVASPRSLAEPRDDILKGVAGWVRFCARDDQEGRLGLGHLGDAEVASADLDAVYDPADLVVAELLKAKAVEAVNGAVSAVRQSFGRGGDIPVGGDRRDDVAGVGVLYAHLEDFGASGLVDGELEAEDGEELLVDNGDGLGVDGVDADAYGSELVG